MNIKKGCKRDSNCQKFCAGCSCVEPSKPGSNRMKCKDTDALLSSDLKTPFNCPHGSLVPSDDALKIMADIL